MALATPASAGKRDCEKPRFVHSFNMGAVLLQHVTRNFFDPAISGVSVSALEKRLEIRVSEIEWPRLASLDGFFAYPKPQLMTQPAPHSVALSRSAVSQVAIQRLEPAPASS